MDPKYKMTMAQAKEDMETYSKIFSSVRLLDVKQLENPENTADKPCRELEPWIKGKSCLNCVALKAIETKSEAIKLKITESEVYQVLARYAEIDGRPYVFEMMRYLGDDFSVDFGGQEEYADKLSKFRDEIYIDVLTGVYNRRYYEEQLKKTAVTGGVVMIDIDDFKLYNDTCGHSAGDSVLSTVVETMKECIRGSDVVIRYGGDEFLLVMPNIAGDEFSDILGNIKEHVSTVDVLGHSGMHLSVSVSGVLTDGELLEDAVIKADKLMYNANGQKNAIITDSSTAVEDGDDKLEILIVDDSDINRKILSGMLGNGFKILEASTGEECVSLLKQHGTAIALILLDIVMPGMSGFDVLHIMNDNHWIEDIPVIMISSDQSYNSIREAYELGVSDYISRPFDARAVHQRVFNTIKLYAKQRRLVKLVSDQMSEKEKDNSMMVSILSHIVEFRNGESGAHVLHIRELTEMLLDRLVRKTTKYNISNADFALIPMASALHDIGKIGIDDKILNKPGRLTPEEFEIMKTHTIIGASMLENLEQFQNEELVKVAHQICRWHHERYDGRGYPDGLKGDEIPIAAQIVSIADVYDALVSERVYKKAFPHEKAIEMILNGECGIFNPILLECFMDIKDDIKAKFSTANSKSKAPAKKQE